MDTSRTDACLVWSLVGFVFFVVSSFMVVLLMVRYIYS